MKGIKKIIGIGTATLMLGLSVASLPVSASSGSTPAGAYGTLYGSTSGYHNDIDSGFVAETKTTKTANLSFTYQLQHNATGSAFASGGYGYSATNITEDVELHHWSNVLKKGEKVAMFTTHTISGTNYVVYTSAVTTY